MVLMRNDLIADINVRDPIDEDIDSYFPSSGGRKPRFRNVNETFHLYISASLISKYFKNNTKIDYCPKKNYHLYLLRDIDSKPSEYMMRGAYFETKCLGSGSGNQITDDLPRKNNGEKYIHQKRIDGQVDKFNLLYPKYGMIINKSGEVKNVQIPFIKKIKTKYIDVEVFIIGEYDIISPFKLNDDSEPIQRIIDLKLTMDVTSTFGPYSWGAPHLVDKTQGVLYNMTSGLPFSYWVFDYKAKSQENKIFHLPTEDNPDPYLAQVARERRITVQNTIRQLINLIIDDFRYQDNNGDFELNPSGDNCDKCPVKSCQYNKEEKFI